MCQPVKKALGIDNTTKNQQRAAAEDQARAAAEQRVAAEEAKQEAIQERAQTKAGDITEAITERTTKRGRAGGTGRRGRSMLQRSAGGGSGFLGRFNR